MNDPIKVMEVRHNQIYISVSGCIQHSFKNYSVKTVLDLQEIFLHSGICSIDGKKRHTQVNSFS